MLLVCVFSMLVMLEVLVNALDVSIAYVNLKVAMNSGDVSTSFFCYFYYQFVAFMGVVYMS
jgi:hypothetical protein